MSKSVKQILREKSFASLKKAMFPNKVENELNRFDKWMIEKVKNVHYMANPEPARQRVINNI